MKPFDFNKVINRYGTDSVRWDKYNQDVIPLSVADMDFAAAPCIVDALKSALIIQFMDIRMPHKI